MFSFDHEWLRRPVNIHICEAGTSKYIYFLNKNVNYSGAIKDTDSFYYLLTGWLLNNYFSYNQYNTVLNYSPKVLELSAVLHHHHKQIAFAKLTLNCEWSKPLWFFSASSPLQMLYCKSIMEPLIHSFIFVFFLLLLCFVFGDCVSFITVSDKIKKNVWNVWKHFCEW